MCAAAGLDPWRRTSYVYLLVWSAMVLAMMAPCEPILRFSMVLASGVTAGSCCTTCSYLGSIKAAEQVKNQMVNELHGLIPNDLFIFVPRIPCIYVFDIDKYCHYTN